MALSLEFERSLQAINPRIALPYWDFTVRKTAGGALCLFSRLRLTRVSSARSRLLTGWLACWQLESSFYRASEWRTSPVFSDDWFGSATPQNAMHTVEAGRFAYVPVMRNASAYSRISNPYVCMYVYRKIVSTNRIYLTCVVSVHRACYVRPGTLTQRPS
jgi:hypothetical protein